LSDLVSVRPRFGRSTHLERDFVQANADKTYHLTPSVFEVLKAIAHAWEAPTERAMTLVGPYGAGKSALGVFLARLVEDNRSAAAALLKAHDAPLAKSLCVPGRTLLPVLVVGSRAPIAPALMRALENALQERDPKALAALKNRHDAMFKSLSPAPREVADLFALAAQECERAGVLLLVDELGKFLEYAAGHPKDSDIFVLQELAEAAARSGTAPLFMLTALHQSAEAYAQKMGRAQQVEWAKVAERFRQVTLFPSDVERMDMVGYALEHSPQLSLNGHHATLTQQCRPFAPVGLEGRFDAMASAAYPLHPLTLLALPPLFRRAGQSHRSLFNFLAGEESHALGRFLRENTFDAKRPPLFTLPALFDYAAETLLSGWNGAGPGNLVRAWAEAVEAVERAENLVPEISPLGCNALKCIGLLSWLRDSKLMASPEVLRLALDASESSVHMALMELQERKLVVWSRARGSYRLWEGGDVDVEAEMSLARAALPADMVIPAASDPDLCPLPRLIARRHSFETGTLRSVKVLACRADQLDATRKAAADELSVVLALTTNEDEAETLAALAAQMNEPHLLIGIATETDALREAALDVAAAGHVATHVTSLAGDRAGRRELELRRAEAESLFRAEWERLFGVTSGGTARVAKEDTTAWLHAGNSVRFSSAREFSAFLSEMADQTYHATPILRNELINRRTLSSAGAAARRSLIAAMLANPADERLGLRGFPPELSMYECVLRATGLHQQQEGAWTFIEPGQNDPAKLGTVWQKFEELIFTPQPQERPVGEIFRILQSPPFGLSEGVLPVLLCAFLRVHERETTLYKEGSFLPEPKLADWEVLLRRPDLFAVAGSRVTGTRAAVVERLSRSMNSEASVVPIVRQLLKMTKTLPEHAWKTRRLPAEVLRLREAFERSRSPEKLLFADLPLALGLPPLDAEEAEPSMVDSFFEALNTAFFAWNRALPEVVATARDGLLQSCGLPPGEEGWKELQARGAGMQGTTAHPLLVPLLNRLGGGAGDESTLEGVLSVIAHRPPRSWSDADVDTFSAHARAVGKAWCDAVETSDKPALTISTPPVPPTKLSPPDQEAADKLAKRIEKRLTAKDGTPLPRHIQHAALQSVLDKLFK
jgi:hypothetical protein